MLNKFNSIISETFDLSPKYIDKDFQCSFNNVDLFTSKIFFKGINNESFIGQEFLKELLNKINLKSINKETPIIIYLTKLNSVYSGIIFSTPRK